MRRAIARVLTPVGHSCTSSDRMTIEDDRKRQLSPPKEHGDINLTHVYYLLRAAREPPSSIVCLNRHHKAVSMNEEPEQNPSPEEPVRPSEEPLPPAAAEGLKEWSRREVIKMGGLLGLGVAVGVGVVAVSREQGPPGTPEGDTTVRKLPAPPPAAFGDAEDPLLGMQRDLVRAMAKPREQRQWMMVIDTRKCVGCMGCTIGCVAENKLPPGVVYRPVLTKEVGSYPNLGIRFTPRPCMQCDEPPCVPVCPARAT